MDSDHNGVFLLSDRQEPEFASQSVMHRNNRYYVLSWSLDAMSRPFAQFSSYLFVQSYALFTLPRDQDVKILLRKPFSLLLSR